MNRTPVKSSNLSSVGYDSATQTLEVEFHSTGVYQYLNVPAYRHAGLMSAASHGEYFDAYIKKGGYSYHKLT